MDTLAFLLLLGAGAFVQTITGFAMGLIVMGGVALFGLIELSSAAAVVSLVSLVNVSVALRRHYRSIYWPMVSALLLGMLPTVFLGVRLLEYLSAENLLLLKSLLGVVILVAGFLLVSKPNPYDQVSNRPVCVLTGMAAGIMGGMYGAGGAPVAYLMYRQPLMIEIVRASLLGTFAMSTLLRIGFISLEGHLTQQVWLLFSFGFPVVVIMTLVGGRVAPLLPDAKVRQAALLLLMLIGTTLILSGGFELVTR